MPFSGPFDLSLGGYTVTPGQGPGSPPPVDLGAYSVFPGGGRVSAPGLGFGPSTAAYNPGSGFFEGAVSGSPESITGAISGPGTPSLGSAGPSVAGSPNAPSDGPAGPAFSSGFLGQNIGILGGNLPSTFASQGVISNAVNQGLSNIGITNPTAQGIANFGLSSLLGSAVPALGPALAVAGIGNAVSKGLTNSAMANTLNENAIHPAMGNIGPVALPAFAGVAGEPDSDPGAVDSGMVSIGPLGTAGPAFAGVGPPGTMGQSISNPNSPTGLVSLYSGTATNNINLSGRASGGDDGPGPAAGAPAGTPGGEEGAAGDTAGGPSGVGVGSGVGAPAGTPGGEEGAGGSTAGDGGGGPSGDKIICAELYRQGLMDEATYRADEAFGAYLRKYDPVALAGYHRWARPVVAVMRRSRWATRGVWLVAKPWAQEMAGRPNLVGTVLMAVGLPLCRLVGQIEARAVRGVA